jgi:ABC-2 type transport system ATP-binding protein
MGDSAPAIELVDLVKHFGPKRALEGITLQVPRGCVFGYVGPNGAGKTTTMRLLTGLTRPTSGDAKVLGHSVLGEPLVVKSLTGYVPESGALFEKFSPLEYLRLVGALYRLSAEAIENRVDLWLRRFGLLAQRELPLGSLSKGMRQKVCWISALLHEPEVLVLDEPLNGLDVEAVALVKDLMTELAAAGRTILYSSHLMDVVSKVCPQLAVVHHGRVVASGTLDEILAARQADSLEQALLGLCREDG